MAIGESIRNAIGTAWRGILGAVSAGQSAFETVQGAIRDLGQQATGTVLLDTSAMEQLGSMAGSWVAARDALGAAAPDDQITSSMITLAPWSMDLNQFNTLPSYHIVLGINVEGLGEPQYRTVTGVTDLPGTVGELQDAMLTNAYAMEVGTTPGGGVGGTVTGLDSITITVGPALG